MKKTLTILTSIALIFVLGFGLAGCKKTNVKSSNSTEKVLANGGVAAVCNNTLYFLNTTTESATIYSVGLNEDGSLKAAPKAYIKNVIGNKNGSIYIFGDYIYYLATSTDRNSAGEVQSGVKKFYRKSLSTGKTTTLYKTSSSDETELQYAFYPSGEKDLYLVVYEKSKQTITSIDVGTNPSKKVIAKDVTGVLFAENGNVGGANNYVFYTHAKDKTLANQKGNIVERILPSGKEKTTISTKDVTYSLLTIANGKLVYSDGNHIYSSTAESLGENDTILSYLPASNYKQIKYYDSSMIVLATIKGESSDSYQIWEISYENGELQKTVICSAQSDAEFLCSTDEKLYFTQSDKIYSVEIGANKNAYLICETTPNDIEGYVAPEVIDGYLYFMSTKDDVVSLYRIDATATTVQQAEKLI